ncbi:MAG: TrbG/VirB9 family P-type conjugative transfer protein [Proteobacteria bacterium]|nr:TrbG/VirB9 family P-type conjugative transfer protein [Pseudomonadota bacterium]
MINLLFFISLLLAPFWVNEAIAQPVPITTDSRIKTLVYNPNEVYQLKFHYGYQSFIEFSDDEEIEMISIGESFAWRLTPAGKRLFVRPLEIAAHTNMVVITNKREYQFDIRSAEYTGMADEELVYTVRFYYPDISRTVPIPPQLSAPNVPPQTVQQNRAESIESPNPDAWVHKDLDKYLHGNIRESELNFDYSFAGLSDNITPIKVYDDGTETYFQFKNNNLIVPSISAVDIFGNETQVSYVIRDNYIVIPTVELQFTLRLADSLLCVFNNKLVVPPVPTRIY